MQEELKNLSHTEPMSTCSQEWVAQVQAHFGKEGMISNFYNAGLTSRTRLFLTLQDEGIFATSIELMKIASRPIRDDRTIPDFLAPNAPANRLDILRGIAPRPEGVPSC